MEALNVAVEMTNNAAQHVAMLSTDLSDQENDGFLTTALALMKFGYRVTIITGSVDSVNENQDLKHFHVRRSGTWIPKSIFGYFKKVMNLCRSVYLALRFIVAPPNPNPNIVITNSNCIVLPIYRYLGNYITIYLPYSTESWMYEKSVTTLFQIKCLTFANEIVGTMNVSKALSAHQLKGYYPVVDLNIARINQQYDLKKIIPTITARTNLFVAFGIFHPDNNLELALVSFIRVLTKLPKDLAKKTHLVVGGLPSNQTLKAYQKEINSIAYLCKFKDNITIIKCVDIYLRKALIDKCTALINTSKQYSSTFSILEAMYMGKTVISVHSVFAEEILMNQITGFILKTDAVVFAKIISKLIHNRLIAAYIGNLAKTDFKYKFSFKIYSQIINEVIIDLSINFTCPIHSNENSDKRSITFLP